MTTIQTLAASPTAPQLEPSLPRLYAMRAGYLFMGLGLAIVKWPHLSSASHMPLYEGVTICMLTAMSLLAFLGLRYPVKMLPVLLFESAWKLLWLALVAFPKAAGQGLDSATTQMLTRNALVVVILAVIPWRYVWRTYVRAPGQPWTS